MKSILYTIFNTFNITTIFLKKLNNKFKDNQNSKKSNVYKIENFEIFNKLKKNPYKIVLRSAFLRRLVFVKRSFSYGLDYKSRGAPQTKDMKKFRQANFRDDFWLT